MASMRRKHEAAADEMCGEATSGLRAIVESPSAETSALSGSDPMQAILEVLRRGERILVCSHSRPDGDAVGSMLAMGMLLEQLGKRAELVTADRVPTIYRG